MEIINLDMTPSTVTPNAHAGQYDASRTVRFMLKNGGVPFTLAGTETITAEITRSDNTEVTVNVTNTSSNYVDVVFDDTVCTVKGLYACELRLKDSDGFDIGSKNFALLVQRDPYDGAGIHVVTVGPADICTFETTLAEPLQSVLVNVLATGGNGTPDNPNPINGYTEANITRCGVNLFDKTNIADGYIDDTTGAVSGGAYYKHTDYMPVVGGQKIYIMTEQTTARWGAWYDKDKNYISGITNYSQTEATAPNNACFIRLTCKTDDTGNLDTFGVNYPSTPTYIPYNGQTYTIAFGQTVYGGVLDVTRGKLHVTRGSVDLGALTWGRLTSDGKICFKTSEQLPDAKKRTSSSELVGLLCTNYFEDTWVNTIDGAGPDGSIALGWNNNAYIGIYDSTKTSMTAADFKTAMNGVLLVYELATPFDIDLTPEVISAVVGENNVFADCGQTTVKYLKAGG